MDSAIVAYRGPHSENDIINEDTASYICTRQERWRHTDFSTAISGSYVHYICMQCGGL